MGGKLVRYHNFHAVSLVIDTDTEPSHIYGLVTVVDLCVHVQEHVNAVAIHHAVVCVEGDPEQRRTRQVSRSGFKTSRCGECNSVYWCGVLLCTVHPVASFCSSRDLQAEVELALPDTSRLSRCNQLQLTSALTSSVCHQPNSSTAKWDWERK